MKFSYLVIFIIVLILGLGGYIFFIRPKTTNPGQNVQSMRSTQQLGKIIPLNPASIPAGEKIEFGTSHGTVAVNNFYKVARGFDGDALVVRRTPEYEIIYDTADSVFGIFITGGSSIGSVRISAESDLVGILGVPRAQVCYLNPVWSASVNLNKDLSGRSYPLSFCSAVPHP